ncbi:MAG: DUF4190 domain-containing protein [Planctomycetota bacterium]|nr:DUF4190 domain-containing protein [Planctomycetota bacterium]
MSLMVRCPKCGETKEHPETVIGKTLVCPGCDQRYYVAKQPARGNYAVVKAITGSGRAGLPIELRGAPMSLLAVLSLVLGLVGFATFGVGGLVGLVLGILGLRKTAGGMKRGRGLAIAGMVIGALSIVGWGVVYVAGDAIWSAFTKPDAVTQQTFVALDAALDRYQDDWGKFPWIETTPDGLMGAVDESPKKNLRPAKGTPDDAAALLYAALNCRLKRGPYATGARLMSIGREANGVHYRLYCDGWGRPIHYDVPEHGKKKPLLTSEGPDLGDQGDQLTND